MRNKEQVVEIKKADINDTKQDNVHHHTFYWHYIAGIYYKQKKGYSTYPNKYMPEDLPAFFHHIKINILNCRAILFR
ncbi:hypothetical protein GCM10022392_21370 [Mucilaginibacter panaciglaebae]|uniref:Uncharacterized protein n=1 Tax=Mucilaginibacter panaciglaebae TaxID=502331 RepID=A0ABP7WV41_9SPHI